MPGRLGPRDPAATSRMMARVKNKDSKAELLLRRHLYAEGLRYRLHAKDVLGKPDIVIRGKKLAIFVDGDFWHGNPEEWRRRGHTSLEGMFPTNTAWWVSKIERTVSRDREVTEALAALGWSVVRLWESEILRDPAHQARRAMSLAGLRAP
jgi:DNA mismatch endonuclease, patch repair protein